MDDPLKFLVHQVEAVDEDQDENGKVSYTIQHPPEAEKKEKVPFSIHPETGHVIVVDTPLIKTSYTLLIEAGDEPFNPSERRVSLAVVQVLSQHFHNLLFLLSDNHSSLSSLQRDYNIRKLSVGLAIQILIA